jgi:hypothetical protein
LSRGPASPNPQSTGSRARTRSRKIAVSPETKPNPLIHAMVPLAYDLCPHKSERYPTIWKCLARAGRMLCCDARSDAADVREGSFQAQSNRIAAFYLGTYFSSPVDWTAGGTELLLPKVFCTSSVVQQNDLVRLPSETTSLRTNPRPTLGSLSLPSEVDSSAANRA